MSNTGTVKVKRPLRARIRSACSSIKHKIFGYKTYNFFDFIRGKIFKCVLATLLVLLCWYIFLHPLKKVRVLFFFTRSCTIETVLTGRVNVGNGSINFDAFDGKSEKVLIDGDLVKTKYTYYEVEDDVIYRYTKNMSGEWHREQCGSDHIITSGSEVGNKLLDPKNYERAEGHLFVWKLKDDAGVKINNLSNIRVERSGGKIAIVGDYSYQGQVLEMSLRFTRFGTTKIDPPWEE